MKNFELLEHTADMGVRSWGATLAMVFENMAHGLYAIALYHPPRGAREKLGLSFNAETPEDLLILFLEELVYLLYTRNLAATQLLITFDPETRLHAQGDFQQVRPENLAAEVKSPTYHQLKITRQNKGWMAEVYFDL